MKVLLLIISILLILVSLLQGGKSEGGLNAFTGSSDLGLFQNVKERGPEKVISLITMILGIVFFILVIIIRVTE